MSFVYTDPATGNVDTGDANAVVQAKAVAFLADLRRLVVRYGAGPVGTNLVAAAATYDADPGSTADVLDSATLLALF